MPPARSRRFRHHTLEEKVALVSEVERRYEAGEASRKSLVESFGITEATYYNWRRAGVRPAVSKALTLRPVELTALVPFEPAAPQPASLTLTAPGGYRVEGLDPASAAALLKALA